MLWYQPINALSESSMAADITLPARSRPKSLGFIFGIAFSYIPGCKGHRTQELSMEKDHLVHNKLLNYLKSHLKSTLIF